MKSPKPNSWTRREFAKTLVLAGASTALSGTRASGANDRVRLGFIGLGNRGDQVLDAFLKQPDAEVVAICDLSQAYMDFASKKAGSSPKQYKDYRQLLESKDLDAVVISTPDHWHALQTIHACQAGKDVYVEKTPSLTLWEGRKMIEAARKYKRVVQVGLQNRSAPYTASAREYIKSGKLGRIVEVKVINMLGGAPFSPQPDCAPPKGLDWDRWLGPAPEVPYNPGRHLSWYDWWDYKGGAIVDDAIHQIDLARAVLDNPAHPKSVCCIGGNYAYQSKREVPELQSIVYDFGDFAMTCESGNSTNYMRKFAGEVRYGSTWPHWPTSATRIEIYGTKALMLLGQHGCGWQVIIEDGKLIDQDKGYFPDKWHQPNFLESLSTRKPPNADIEQGHRSACLVHLANLSYRVGNKQLIFDPEREKTNSEQANKLLKPAYRKNYRIPEHV